MALFNFGRSVTETVPAWRELSVFSAYRLFLAATLFSVFWLKLPPEFLGSHQPELYLQVSILYLAIAIVLVFTSLKEIGRFHSNARLQLVLDIVFLILIIDSSGGLSTGLGTLLVVVVVAGGALIPGRQSAFIAAIATLAVLVEVSYSQISGDGGTNSSHAGLLGATFFATAILAQTLSYKMKTMRQLADQRGQDVNKLAMLNQHIISSMQTGIIVVDDNGRVTLSNQSARHLIDAVGEYTDISLSYFCPVLAEQLTNWKKNARARFEPIQIKPSLPEVLARFTALESGETLIYLDSASLLAQQAQQMKLASLGRLTASIAHEIRNPLGAISHAGELLAERYEEDGATIKLTDIIQRHSERMNGIIETILSMSRRKKIEPKVVILALWLENFVAEYCDINDIDKADIDLKVSSSLARVSIDEEQLHQIISNLVNNAWHYSVKASDTSRVKLRLYTRGNDVSIDVKDNGSGISDEIQQYLFEPFHSDRQGGTGLGLYLAREMCQANGGQLNYVAEEGGACFRVSFPIEKQETLF
jgi:two-component system sensor histidine kinase PilS (NtrC family)